MTDPGPSASPRKFPWGWYGLVLGLLALLTLFPLPLLALAYAIADANGCAISTAGVQPCLIGDTDWGGTLALMAMSGWLLIATLPMFALGLAIGVLVLVIHRFARSKPEKSSS